MPPTVPPSPFLKRSTGGLSIHRKAMEQKRDKLGRRYCIDQGKRVPCPDSGDKKPTEESKQETPTVQKPKKVATRHDRVLKAISKVARPIAKGLQKSDGLSDEQRSEYGLNIARVLRVMPKNVRRVITRNLSTSKFYPSTKELGLSIIKEFLQANPNQVAQDMDRYRAMIDGIDKGTTEISGGVQIDRFGDMHLHLDGDDVGIGKSEGRHKSGRTALETYAHELGHALDGPHHFISESPEWIKAYQDEIAHAGNDPESTERTWIEWITGGKKVAKLSEYATKDLAESVAEFSRLLYGSKIPLETIEKDFPLASKIFKDQGFWPDREGKDDAVFGDIFDEKIELDDNGSHADSRKVEKPKESLPTVKPSPFAKKSLSLSNRQIKAISPKKPLKYGCLMAVIPPLIAKQITDWTLETVPDFHLGEGGRELVPHATILFGFTDSSTATVEAVKAFMSQYGPIPVRLDKLDLFTSGYGKWKNEDGDVLHVTVDSPQLHKIHGALSESFPCHDTHPEFRPHVTLCYLDPGEVAQSYLKENPPFLGLTLLLDEMEWSGADGNKERFSLSIFPSFGEKAFEEKKDKRGHRYCVDDGRVKCPDQGQGEGKTQKRGHPPKPPAAKPQEGYQVPLGDTPPPPIHFPDVTREEVITRGDVTKGVRGRPREGKDRTEKARSRRKEIAQNLKQAPVASVTNLNAGKNVTQIITLGNGGKAVFKPKSGEGEMNENGVRSSLRSSIPLGTYCLREAASYNLAETLGFGDLVPVTVLKDVNGETGSAQQHIADCSVAMDLELGRWDGPEDMTRAAVFDFVSMNSDRHTGNWLIAEDGKIRLIDNGLSFPEDVWDAFIDNSFLLKMCFITDAPIPELVKTWGEKEFTAARETLKKSQLPEKAIELTLGRMKALRDTQRTTFRAFIVDCRRAGIMQ